MHVEFSRVSNYCIVVAKMLLYCLARGKNPGVLAKLNPSLVSGGKCTQSKYEMQNYLAKKGLFPKTILLKGTVKQKVQQLEKAFGKKTIVLKPDQGIRSIGFRIVKYKDRKKFLTRVEPYTYIAQEFITKEKEMAIFIVRRKKLLVITGLALLDSSTMKYKTSERHNEQYFSRDDLITPKLTTYLNKVFPTDFFLWQN